MFPHSSPEDDIPILGSESFHRFIPHFTSHYTLCLLVIFILLLVCTVSSYLWPVPSAHPSIMLLALLSHWTANPSHPCFCCRLCKRNWLLLCKFHLKTHLPSPWPMTPSLLSNKAIQSYSLSLSFISPCSFVLSETLKYGTQPLAFCTFFTLALL